MKQNLQKQLIRAIASNDMFGVKMLLSFGASPNQVSPMWWQMPFFVKAKMPLLVAVEKNSNQIVKLLLLAGANPNKQGHNGMTPLTFACGTGSIEIVQSLLAAGANVNLPDETGLPLFHAAVAPSKDVLELLLTHGADPSAVLQGTLRYFSLPPVILKTLIDFGGEAPPEILEFLDGL